MKKSLGYKKHTFPQTRKKDSQDKTYDSITLVQISKIMFDKKATLSQRIVTSLTAL